MYKIFILPLLAIFLNIESIHAQTYEIKAANAEVHGSVSVAPDYTGTSDQLSGTIDLAEETLHFKLPLKTLKTGNATRDKHMYKALEVSKYPEVAFEGKIKGLNLKTQGKQKITVAGAFTLHGQQKQLEIPGTIEINADGLRFNASFSINITEFGMERPSTLFLTVDDKHDITVSGTAKGNGY